MRRRREKGFTLVELMVSLAVAGILLGIIYAIFIAQRRGHVVQEQVAEMQQNARVATDQLTRAVQAIGNNVDRALAQHQVRLCAPYELIFDSDVDTTVGGVAAGTTLTPTYTYTVTPYTSVNYHANAETYLFALVANGPRQYDLVRTKFWSVGGVNQNQPDIVAQNLAARDTTGNLKPLFLYWVDYTGGGAAPKLWGDTNNDNLMSATEAAAVGPVDINDALFATARAANPNLRLDDVIRMIQIQVTTETKSPDSAYAVNSGYRQAEMISHITPRNLWQCPVLAPPTLSATPYTPATVPTTAVFNASYMGAGYGGKTVQFNLTGPGVGGLVTFNDITTTAANGDATCTIGWPTCASGGFKTLFDATGGGALTYTLTANLFQQPTAAGSCSFIPVAVTFSVVPGDPATVVCTGYSIGSPNEETTCAAGGTLTFQVYDACGVPVPWSSPRFYAFVGSGAGSLTPTAAALPASALTGTPSGTYPYMATATFVLDSATAWPSPTPALVGSAPSYVPILAIAESSGIRSVPALDLPGSPADPFSLIKLKARPTQIVNLSPLNALASAVNDDCPSANVPDTLALQDCRGYAIDSLAGGPNTYQVVPTVNRDPAQASVDQGAITPNPLVTIASGVLDFSYVPPTCTLGPGVTVAPTVDFALQKNGASIFQTSTASPLMTKTLSLQACSSCSVTADPSTMSRCWAQTTVTVRKCGAQWLGQPVQFVVTGSSGNGSFDATSSVTTQDSTFVVDPTNPDGVIAQEILYLGSAKNGSVLTVTAQSKTLSATGSPLWACTGTVDVTNLCSEIKMYTFVGGVKTYIGTGTGEITCLSQISTLYFEVTDCQYNAASLAAGNRAIKVYSVSEDGLTLDMEYADLRADAIPAGHNAPQLLRSVAALPVQELLGSPTQMNGTLTYPTGKNVQFVAGYTDPNDPADDSAPTLSAPVTYPITIPASKPCQLGVTLTAPLPLCFPNAVTSGAGGSWNGNFMIHWGDVVIRGNADPASTPKTISKLASAGLNSAVYSGSGNQDRFFDIYVGKNDDGTGGLMTGGDPALLQPFKAAGYGNYFHEITNLKINSMITFLDYSTMKSLAKARNAYWYTLAVGNAYGLPAGQVRNPATGQHATLETVVGLSGIGARNAYYDGQYIFVDAAATADPGPAYTSATIAALADASVSNLPSFSLTNIYTEGVFYIAGSLLLQGPGGRNISILTPPRLESRYDHNTATFTQADLPISPDTTQTQATVTLNGVNINGGVYVLGTIDQSGNPAIFGALTAERGVGSGGNPELWYNYRLNQSGGTLCIACCKLAVVPAAATLEESSSLALTTHDATGTVTWASLNPTVATVDSTGLVHALPLPSGVTSAVATISAVDANNCVEWATITVIKPCSLFAVAPSSASVVVGSHQALLATGFPATSAIAWTVPAGILHQDSIVVNAAVPSSTLTVTPYDSGGPITVTATDSAGVCATAQTASVTAICPSLAVSFPSNPISVGSTTTASLVAVLDPFPSGFTTTWSSSDPTKATVSAAGVVTGVGTGSTTITATLKDPTGAVTHCVYSAVMNVDAAATCAAETITTVPSPPSVIKGTPGQPVTLTLNNSPGTGTVTWSKSSTIVNLSATTGTTTVARPNTTTGSQTVQITSTDTSFSPACVKTATVTITEPTCSMTLSASPTSIEKAHGAHAGEITVITVASKVGTITWTYDSSKIVLLSQTATTATFQAGSSATTTTITANDDLGYPGVLGACQKSIAITITN